MLFKLSFKNILKSIKDYSIYFFTLVVAVAIFYIFNSLDAQNSMLILTDYKHNMIEGLVTILGIISIFVSIVLGFLIIYSNNFLVKRRKKEIGLYLTLGMSKRNVSLILVMETFMVGLISAVTGLILGIVFSQGLSIITAHLFEADMSEYAFVFSSSALFKTIIYFSIIFLLVMIFNVISLSRYKLIDLLHAKKKNESIKLRNKYITIISFILSISLLIYAYHLLFNDALLYLDSNTIKMLISGALGVLLFFFSLSGFLLNILIKIKNIYYKNLNMFLLKQINSKINTSVISTTVICLMLLLTVCILSGSLAFANAFNQGLKENNLTDFTIRESSVTYNLPNILKEDVFNDNVKEYVLFKEYTDIDLQYEDLITDEDMARLKKEYGTNLAFTFNVPIIAESNYKALMEIFGKEYIDIKNDEYLILSNLELTIDSYRNAYENKNEVVINNHTLKPGSEDIINTALENYNSTGNDGVIVVSDEVLSNDFDYNYIIVGNYNDVSNEEVFVNYYEENPDYYITIRTKLQMEASSVGLKAILTFIGLYLGIIFAISSVTILAIGQLSESSDNKERYKIIKQIGADEKLVNKTLFAQIFITFMLPLAVALFHAFFGLREVNSLVKVIGDIDLSKNIGLTTLFMVTIYGGYFIITYICSKNIIKDEV